MPPKLSKHAVKPNLRGIPAATYLVTFPNGQEGEFRCYNVRDREAVAYIYQKDKRWYVAGVDPIGHTRNGPNAGLETAPARLKERP